MSQPMADLKDCENRAAEKQCRWLILPDIHDRLRRTTQIIERSRTTICC